MSSMPQKTIAGFRLSADQERLFSLHSSEQTYVGVLAIQLDGPLDKPALSRALARVIERNEILRTTFHLRPDGNVPLQVVANANGNVPWSELDLTHVANDRRNEAVAARFAEFQTSNVDLTRYPLWRASLLQLAQDRHVLIFALPALCADNFTLKNILDELRRSYAGDEAGSEQVQYADFAAWQHELLENEQAEQARSFWEKRKSAAGTGRLPFELRVNHEASFTPAIVTLNVDSETGAQVSDEVFLLTCWLILLQRYTTEPDITVGLTVDGRSYEELHPALGLFARTLPLHMRIFGTATFQDLMRRVDQNVGEMREWQEYFVPRSGREEINSFSFEYLGDLNEVSAAGLSFNIWRQTAYFEPFKVKLVCSRRNGQLALELQYDRARFESQDIEQMAEHFKVLLRSVARHPNAPLEKLETIGDEERHRLLYEFNHAETDSQPVALISQLFEEQSARTPDNAAVIFGEEQTTYAELNARANQLARHLRSLGAGPEVRVGIFLERSIEMVLAILAVLKAGATYVPLDPSYPEERLSFMIEDSAASMLLTVDQHAERLPVNWGYVVSLDADWPAIALESAEDLAPITVADNAAYVIYTSGSTGRPKGVVITHRNLVSSTFARLAYYSEPVRSFLLLPSFAFDSSVAVIFWSLCSSGGTLVLPLEGAQRDPAYLSRLIETEQVSHVLCLPSVYSLLLAQEPATALSSLRTVIVAGEACPSDLLDEHFDKLPETSLYNEYGPTEGTVWSTVSEILPQSGEMLVSIGKPIPNSRVYLLDHAGRLAPIGAPGEIYIGGAGIARGYLDRPELTAERFVPDPFAEIPGKRLYRTGDVARYRGDGEIEFRGRSDNQVKLRGYRIELGEIEATLTQHRAVRECAVVLGDEGGDRRLIAYLATGTDADLSTEELRRQLKEKLPDYMVPAVFIILDELPLTPNGKVDRSALPDPSGPARQSAETYVAPATPTEAVLADMWAEVLGLERVGVRDNFFDLGGHSLLATQLVSRLRNTLQLELPVALLFEAPTVTQLADAIPKYESVPGQTATIAELISQVQSLDDSDVEQMFEAERVETMVEK
jgi:amino acid adenylation domain-containing protein